MTFQLLLLEALVSSVLIGFLASVFGGVFVTKPKIVAVTLSPAFYIGGALTGLVFGSTIGENIILIFVGAAGGVIGWLIYGGIALR